MDSPMKATFKALSTTMNGKQFHAVYIQATNYVTTFCAAATALAIGILNNNPRAVAGATCEVVVLGACKAKLGVGGATAGDFLISDGSGQLITLTLGVTTVNIAVARALITGIEGDIIPVFVCPMYANV
jgi:hypothetical protein